MHNNNLHERGTRCDTARMHDKRFAGELSSSFTGSNYGNIHEHFSTRLTSAEDFQMTTKKTQGVSENDVKWMKEVVKDAVKSVKPTRSSSERGVQMSTKTTTVTCSKCGMNHVMPYGHESSKLYRRSPEKVSCKACKHQDERNEVDNGAPEHKFPKGALTFRQFNGIVKGCGVILSREIVYDKESVNKLFDSSLSYAERHEFALTLPESRVSIKWHAIRTAKQHVYRCSASERNRLTKIYMTKRSQCKYNVSDDYPFMVDDDLHVFGKFTRGDLTFYQKNNVKYSPQEMADEIENPPSEPVYERVVKPKPVDLNKCTKAQLIEMLKAR